MKIPIHIKWTSWIGMLAIAVQLNAVPISFLLFRMNQDEIIRTECEHKMPNCNGNCFLMKQLAKTAGSETDKKTERATSQLDRFFLIGSENKSQIIFSTTKDKLAPNNNGTVLTGWPSLLLQPPRFC